jgi:uncharacterized protein YgiM (DUF1202 family)
MLNVLKVFIGIILGLLTMGVLSASAGYYFFVTNLSAKPTKPKFAEERNPSIVSKAEAKKPIAQPTNKPEIEQEKTSKKELPPGAYGATVTWETGVSLRKEPIDTSEKIGSVGFREKIAVLKTNDDKSWVQVRSNNGSVEGWLKMGNIERDAAGN